MGSGFGQIVEVDSEDLRIEVIDWGARLHRCRVRVEDDWRDIVLSLPDERAYADDAGFLGASVGRVANRIAHGHLVVDGVEHRLAVNDRGHTLHGGPQGFDRQRWSVSSIEPDAVELRLVSPDGDQGFPGTLTVTARFEVRGSALRIDYRAGTDAPTVVSLSAHAYWRLGGTSIDDHELTVPATSYLPTDATGIPTGEEPIEGTPYDLREPRPLGERGTAFDHHLVVPGAGLRELAVLRGHGLRLRIESDQPGLQVFTADTFAGPVHGVRAGVALEPQHHPDAVHHPEWPGVGLRPGEVYSWSSVITVDADR